MRQLARRFVLLAGASIVAVGCLSPTLPLPPPVEPEVERIGAGQYLLRGEIPESGFVLILNTRTNAVYGALTDKSYVVPVAALPRDQMQVWYESVREVSDVVWFEIPDDPVPTSDGGTN